MNWNQIPDGEKLALWKKLRDDIKFENLSYQLDKIAKFTSTIPFGTNTLDYYKPSIWPSPWEILYRSNFCISSISLLIVQTMLLLRTNNIIELHLVQDNKDIFLLPVINNTHVLNYESGIVSDYTQLKLITLKVFKADEIQQLT